MNNCDSIDFWSMDNQQSFTLKAESKRLLEEAKAAVEREIEKVG